MKKIFTLTVVALLATMTAAAQPDMTAASRNDLVPMLKSDVSLNLPAMPAMAPRHAEANGPVLERPAGKVYESVSANFSIGVAYGDAMSTSSYSARLSEIVEGDDGCIYIKTLPALIGAPSYARAEKAEGDTITLARQVVYQLNGTDYSLVPVKWQLNEETNTGEFVVYDGVVKMIYKDGSLKSCDEDVDPTNGGAVIGIYIGESSYYGYVEFNLNYYPNPAPLTELPEGVEAQPMVIKYLNGQAQLTYANMNVAFTDSEVYMNVYEDTYVKGTIEGDKVTFEKGQYLGPNSQYGYHLYFVPGRIDSIFDAAGNFQKLQAVVVDEIVFDYDKENQTLHSSQMFAVNAGLSGFLVLVYYWDSYIFKYDEVPATPADPTIVKYVDAYETYLYNYLQFSISPVDAEGNYIEPKKLSYRVFADGEPFVFTPDYYTGLTEEMEELPFGFVDPKSDISTAYFKIFFYPDESMGLQTIFRGGGEERRSNIVTIDVNTQEITVTPDGGETVGISAVESEKVTGVVYHDVAGRQVAADARGLVLMTMKRADGTQRTVKVVR